MHFEGFVPVDPASLDRLHEAERRCDRAQADLERALTALIDLAEDLKIDAVGRLRTRGASAAQVERYEQAFRQRVEDVRSSFRALGSARAQQRDATATVAG